jgi:hypothetical protein
MGEITILLGIIERGWKNVGAAAPHALYTGSAPVPRDSLRINDDGVGTAPHAL